MDFFDWDLYYSDTSSRQNVNESNTNYNIVISTSTTVSQTPPFTDVPARVSDSRFLQRQQVLQKTLAEMEMYVAQHFLTWSLISSTMRLHRYNTTPVFEIWPGHDRSYGPPLPNMLAYDDPTIWDEMFRCLSPEKVSQITSEVEKGRYQEIVFDPSGILHPALLPMRAMAIRYMEDKNQIIEIWPMQSKK
ncbi:hypothetical protein K505DRAFT_359954 [Melanomma pulvis-pyrius CBS 109.77]|uniref:Uncharacterized protein n=1 Tax=Melanomma pulvis-pyrius CBS 109.77 TaxID=1314802 RepID=A0A6A6XHE1_9PLEO|nr:hypothetical protein K505DRAFT_359954 [Melanomma pulvis-pyrius CBS 109.77]